MALPNSGITISAVADELGISANQIEALCTSENINLWSRWKPVQSNLITMTADGLKTAKFGLDILQSNTYQHLVTLIKDNNGIGCIYRAPTSNFRLGDFRNYNKDAIEPVGVTYLPSEEVSIGGVTSSNHPSYERIIGGLEAQPTKYNLGVADLYPSITINGIVNNMNRGAVITDGKKSVFWTHKFYWWSPLMQDFANKTVTIYEFYTNATSTPSQLYTPSGSDKFFALPNPMYTLKVKNNSPADSSLVITICTPQFADASRRQVEYEVYFDATSYTTRGGELINVSVKLAKDRKGLETISSRKLADRIYVSKGTVSAKYNGYLDNYGNSEMVYFLVYYNNTLQFATTVMPGKYPPPRE